MNGWIDGQMDISWMDICMDIGGKWINRHTGPKGSVLHSGQLYSLQGRESGLGKVDWLAKWTQKSLCTLSAATPLTYKIHST